VIFYSSNTYIIFVINSADIPRNHYTDFIQKINKLYIKRSVGIATGYGLNGQRSIPVRGKKFFSTASGTGCGAQPASYAMGA
jgi:predicted ATP-grasp superfamily ATP-dependent carboligase